MRLKPILFLLLPLLASAAEEHGEHAGGDPLLSYKWINFGILALAMAYAVAKYLLPMLSERAAGIQKDLAESRAAVSEAEGRIRDLESKLGNFEGELQSIRERMSQERNAEAKRISEQTANLLDKLNQQKVNELANATKVAEQQLRAFTAAKALELAQARLSAAGQGDAQKTLVAAFVGDLKKLEAR
jgi:F-type H+-transporting ATPase subunit b